MHGMFRSNGGCGYVKKPDFLMNVGPDGQVFNPKETLPVKKTLKVRVMTKHSYYTLPLNFLYNFFHIDRLKCTWEMGGTWISNKHTLIYTPHLTSIAG